jgi:hypothetical protein
MKMAAEDIEEVKNTEEEDEVGDIFEEDEFGDLFEQNVSCITVTKRSIES